MILANDCLKIDMRHDFAAIKHKIDLNILHHLLATKIMLLVEIGWNVRQKMKMFKNTSKYSVCDHKRCVNYFLSRNPLNCENLT